MTHPPAPGDYALTVADEQFVLLPERAIFWPAAAALLIADLHLGKAAAFRAAALAVPEGGAAADLARLSSVLARTAARRLIVLGDLLHARTAAAPPVLAAFAAWRAAHPALDVLLVRGNHDHNAGDPPAAWGVACVDEPYLCGPFALCHHPDRVTTGYRLAGHVHPAVRLRGRGRQHERLPCFLFGPNHGLLPAFGSFTGVADVQPEAAARVFVIADQAVVPIA
jgi:DNA ligase-associated metallophosphoesterase